ncbi:MAG: RNA polymerase sigma factor [Desulfovibrionales bacterium]
MLERDQTLELFLRSVERRSFRMAQIACGNTEDALDIIQETMLSFVRAYARKTESHWKPLYYRVLQNKITDHHRRSGIRRKWRVWPLPSRTSEEDTIDSHGDGPDSEGKNPEEQVFELAALDRLDKSLEKLSLRQRQAFLLRAWEGMSVEETARAMQCTKGTVKQHYTRAVQTLREDLGDFES